MYDITHITQSSSAKKWVTPAARKYFVISWSLVMRMICEHWQMFFLYQRNVMNPEAPNNVIIS